MNVAPCEICGHVHEVTPPRPRDSMNPFARMVRALLRPLGRFVHALTFTFCGFALRAMTLGWIMPFFGVVQNGLLLSGLLLCAIWTIRLATRTLVWVFAPATRQTKRPGGRGFLVLPMCLVALWVLNRFDAPLRVAFALSRASLEQVAASPLGGYTMGALPSTRGGLYRVTRAERAGQSVRIEVTNNEFLSGTRAGFAKCPNGCPGHLSPIPWGNSRPSYTRIAGDWYWWQQYVDTF